MSGGSHADARAIAPPDFAGFVLAGSQSGYGDVAARLLAGAVVRSVRPTAPAPACLRKSRRSIDIVGLLVRRVSRTMPSKRFKVKVRYLSSQTSAMFVAPLLLLTRHTPQ